MTRQEEIRQAALDYICKCNMFTIPDDTYEVSFIEGATWADSYPQSPWHSVADGDLPTELKGDCVDMPFIVVCKDGTRYSAYYALEEDEENCYFYDDCDCELDVDYWMEIPQLPKESEVSNA